MTRATMRAILRRRLNDAPGEQYSDVELNEMLNVALTLVGKEILKIRAYGFLQWELWDIALNQQRFPMTDGTLYLAYVGYRSSPTGTFTRLDPKPFQKILSGEEAGYAHAGRELFLSAGYSSSAVVQGLRVIHVPALALADDTSTTEDKGIPRPLDMATVVWAQELITPETGEARKEIAAERQQMLADLPQYLRTDADGPEYLKLDFVRYPTGTR